ncbi:MAG: 3-hydroxyacyl-CoA dehydrogenase NAD-binding domain-containing protein [Anaerolineae bacterium]|nr:3-hydroxyacyl-CoA dehydrogenase NAD-binding domain-containing protein [Anaerolineae bacterium]
MNTIAVIGSGTMGAGIAQAASLADYEVILYDLNDDILQSALQRIRASIDKGVARGKTLPTVAERAKAAFTLTTSLERCASADLVIEAAPEKLDLKRSIFATLDTVAPQHTILASNTSSLSISAIAAATQRPDRVTGLHFFNPAHIMKLVEIICGDQTSDETVAAVTAFAEQAGKTVVLCKDTPAFIVNRVARPFYGEALRMFGEEIADVATIDKLIRSAGFRMGPFELIDLIGCDVNLAVTQSVYDAYFQEPRYRPHPIQRRMVESGRLGRKSGRGFYEYKS